MKWINSRGTVNRSARKDLSRGIVERTGEKCEKLFFIIK